MTVKVAIALLALLLVAGTASRAMAQDTPSATHNKTRTLTGCLQKGDDANEYRLATAKGSTWELTSNGHKLSNHVGHTVTITGVVANAEMHGAKEDAKAETKEHDMDKASTEHGHLKVTNLKMVSD